MWGVVMAGVAALITVISVSFLAIFKGWYYWPTTVIGVAGFVFFSYIVLARIRTIKRLLVKGVAVSGTIRSVRAGNDDQGEWKKIDYEYTLNGRAYKSRLSWNGDINPGRDIIVLVDPDRPRKSIIKEIFAPG